MSNSNCDYILVGEIRRFPYTFVPDGFFPCDGRPLEVNKYQMLNALISCRYGGDGVNIFNLPDLNKDLSDDDPKYYIAYDGNFPYRS